MIKAIYTGSEFLEDTVVGDEVGIVLESTSFYAEQGGQVCMLLTFLLATVYLTYLSPELLTFRFNYNFWT